MQLLVHPSEFQERLALFPRFIRIAKDLFERYDSLPFSRRHFAYLLDEDSDSAFVRRPPNMLLRILEAIGWRGLFEGRKNVSQCSL